ERARAHDALIKEFFSIRPVVTGSLADLEPQLAGIKRIEQSVDDLRTRFEQVAGGTPSPAAAESAGTDAGPIAAGAQTLQVRLLAAKVLTFEERDRQHMDEAGQRLIAEVQGAVRELDFRRAVAAVPRLEAWLAEAGRRASPPVRARTAILLADLAL